MEKTYLVKCNDCGVQYEVSSQTYHFVNKSANPVFRCPECKKKYRSKMMKERMANMSPEEKAAMYKKAGKSSSERLAKLSKEEFADRMKRINKGRDKWLENRTEEEKERISKIHAEANKRRWESKTEEEKEADRQAARERWANKTDEEKQEHAVKSSERWKTMDPIKRIEFGEKQSELRKEQWKNRSEEEKAKIISKSRSSAVKNKNNNPLTIKFEEEFNKNSYLKNNFVLLQNRHTSTSNVDHDHEWDYAIFSTIENKIVMIVDLDGDYYHGDKEEYDGYGSGREELDEIRYLTIPDGYKYSIIKKYNLMNDINRTLQNLQKSYHDFKYDILNAASVMPFPQIAYTDTQLIESYERLKSISIEKYSTLYNGTGMYNNRIGDFLIFHFHSSIYRDHCKGQPSPFDTWKDRKLLKEAIKRNVLFYALDDTNNVLQGFNVYNDSRRVSVFSAAKANILIQKYMNSYDEIFDPFSGYSGRMLGAVSLGKRYVGQDISLPHVNESNNMIDFLRKYKIEVNVVVTQKDILQSSGEYECLFTCPPYGDQEQWQDVPVSTRSCDEWIDECLKRFKCKRYVFIVDDTEKYKDNKVESIQNRSWVNPRREYVIVIDR